MTETDGNPIRPGLVLTGGGARAAYQVGVLKAISDLLPDLTYPFPVIAGTSAGAINAIALGGGPAIFSHTIDQLVALWQDIRPENVYRADMLGLSRSMTTFLQGAVLGETSPAGTAMLNNAPLRQFLEKQMDFARLRNSLKEGLLHAVGINACGYSTGRNICFFEGHADIVDWSHEQRSGQRSRLGLDHVMASSAIPTIFPPVKLGREFFGDGVTRQMAHLSPAIHMGATRILAIGVSANRVFRSPRREAAPPPNMGQVMENVLNGMFLDTLEYDIERLELVNAFLASNAADCKASLKAALRHIPLLVISPTRPVFEVARPYLHRLPGLIRRMMGRNLQRGEGGISIASYLLFDADFCRDLIKLGYADAQARSRELTAFFSSLQND